MRLNFSDFPRKAQLVLLASSAALPAAAMAAGTAGPAFLTPLALVALSHLLLALLCLTLPGRLRLLAGVLGAGAMVGLGLPLLWAAGSASVLAMPVLYAILLLALLPMAAWPRERELHPVFSAGGLALHALAQIMVGVARRTGRLSPLLRAQGVLLASFTLFLLLAMLSFNRAALEYASLGRQRPPLAMRLRNRLLIVALLAVSLLLASLPAVARAVIAARDALLALIGRIVAFLLNLFTPGGTSGGADGAGAFELPGALEEAEPGWLAVLLERLLMAAAFIALALLALLLLRLVLTRLSALLRALAERLSLFASAASEDYVDEITDTREDAGERSSLLHLLHRLDLSDDRRLPPGERIRRRYLLARLRHRDWRASQTARETLPPDAAQLYERARYSEHEITRQEAERFVERVK